ncbi:hypothetical protein MKD50_18580 [Cupriavidus sp. WGtm5]|uniref:hypothetical protein n=1 Tax=Cupriavidus TaxID=106589 RepID=UPI000E102676|nr:MULTISPECIES: hypothetical protein [Cupriavidus]MCO4891394.1 hypothetical protein [Cupriavidus sp. WGtm5]ULX50567.1 hypothetical protein A9P79_00945 [Cupriavidus taiwanensis]SPA40580.1 conserved hypothetical protein [Cupriavidus taiwanensis]SPA41509.1 conserved hypothetical protein [Cupriavidus taiwanensis]
MATANVPFSSTPHAAALARILHVTRSAWALDRHSIQATTAPAGAATPTPTLPLSRRARLARAAARAFEAQVMAIRCRQAVVA